MSPFRTTMAAAPSVERDGGGAAPLLDFRGLSVSFGGMPALRDVSLQVGPGRVAAVVGESGSGKSTLLRAAMGLLGRSGRVDSGSVTLDARLAPGLPHTGGEGRVDLCRLFPRRMRPLCGRVLAMVGQDATSSLTPVRKVGEQFWEAACAHDPRADRDEVRVRSRELLDRLLVPDPDRVLRSYPFELSGGMGQRVGIALAMLCSPAVILADEPTSALDPVSQREVVAQLARLVREEGMGMVVVTHVAGVARALADDVLVLRRGVAVESGSASRVLSAPGDPYARELLGAAPSLAAVGAWEGCGGPARAGAGGGDPREETPVLELRHVGVVYARRGLPDVEALRDVSLTLMPGQALAVVGESGGGKSTLARVACGLLAPTGGTALLCGRPLEPSRAGGGRVAKEARLASSRAAQIVFQDAQRSFDPRRTLESGVAEGLRNLRGMPRAQALAAAREELGRCGLDPALGRRHAAEVSGGQCQRAAIARAVAPGPRLLVCDEATSALDALTQLQVARLIARLRRERGLAVLWVCHDMALALRTCDFVAVMDHGALVEYGPSDRVVGRPRSQATKALVEAVLP